MRVGLSWQQTVGREDAGTGTQFLCLNFTSSLIIQRLVQATGETQEEEPRVCIVCVGGWAGASFGVSRHGDCRKRVGGVIMQL